jgi:RHS repeat-associated protein
MLSLSWRPVLGAPPHEGPSPAATPRAAAAPAPGIVGHLAPAAVEWVRPEGIRSAAVLFDGDRTTSLRTGAEAVIRVTLPGARTVDGLGTFGGADGVLSVSSIAQAGTSAVETPIAGLQDLDIGGLPLRWNRFWADRPVEARVLALHWRPRSPAAELRELELFGLVPELRDRPAALADRLLAGVPADALETWADPEDGLGVSRDDLGGEVAATFRLRLETDPRLVERAFLVYELHGLPHWTATRRQINGFSTQGGFGAELGAGSGGLQIEEISPEWLFQGDNEVHFTAADDPDPVGYRVARVRVVAFTRAGPGAADPAARAAGDLGRLSDGDLRTGLRGGRGLTSLTLPLENGAQPASVALYVTEKIGGRITAATVRADGKTSTAETIVADGLAPGWHGLPLDRLPAGAGVRLAWEAGREGAGLISEVRLTASPAPLGTPRELVVSYPLHGECVDHQAYVRGFVRGTTAEPARPELVGEASAALGADGAFAFAIPEPPASRGKPWKIPLRARFADGAEVARDVGIDACADRPAAIAQRPAAPGGPRPLVEDEGAPFGKILQSEKGGEVAVGGVRLEVPADALERDTRITVRPLVGGEVRALDDPMMENVGPDRKAFRLGPHNLRFHEPVRLTLPYDRSLVRRGIEPDEIGIFFFDEDSGRWQRLPTVADPDGRVIVAETTHFTDFMAGTLPTPDHPSEVSNTPNMIRDLKVGDPTSEMALIQPPTASNDGAVHLHFPIELPPGRNGMQPHLGLEYSSEGGNGTMGVGWSLPISHIEVDTKFGAPRFDAQTESERYLLDGDELLAVWTPSNDDIATRQNDRAFRRRVEHGFESILRDGSGDDVGQGWRVVDNGGTVYEYADFHTLPDTPVGNEGTIDLSNEGPNAYWGLARVKDTYNNSIVYHYTKTFGQADTTGASQGDRNTWEELLPSTITYTNVAPAEDGKFKVTFEYNTRTGTFRANSNRLDIFSNARFGREVQTRHLMTGLRVEYFDSASSTWKVFRRYDFTYVTGEFGKSLLSAIAVSSGSGAFYTHNLTYKTLDRDSQQRVKFGPPIRWGTLSPDSGGALGRATSTSMGANGFAGLGPIDCYPHAGAGMSGSAGGEATQEVFTDVNGDGLPDIMEANGTVYLNGFGAADRSTGAFSAPVSTGMASLGASSNWSRTFAAGFHFPGEWGGNGSNTLSHTVQSQGILDINGDGLPDLFNGNQYQCNLAAGSVCTGVHTDTGISFASMASWPGGDTSGYPFFAEPPLNSSSGGGGSFATGMVMRWMAPFTGTINVRGAAQRTFNTAGMQSPPPADPVTVSIYSRAAGPPTGLAVFNQLWTHTFVAADAAACFPGLPATPGGPPNQSCSNNAGGFTLSAFQSDEYYFVVTSPSGNQRNSVSWNPLINYTDVGCNDLNNPRNCVSAGVEAYGPPIYQYAAAQDLRLAGGAAVPWVDLSADTRADGTTPTATFVHITGTITKTLATADNLRFRIVKLPGNGAAPVVISDSTLNSNQVNAAVAVDQTVQVKGQWAIVPPPPASGGQWTLLGDQLVFQVLSDSPFDPAAVSWTPVVSYNNYCYPDPDDQARLLAAPPHTLPPPSSVKIKCTNDPGSTQAPSDVIGGAASQIVQVQYPAFRYKPATATLQSNPLSPTLPRSNPIFIPPIPGQNSGFFFITGGFVGIDPASTGLDADNPSDRGQVVLLVQTPNRLIGKLAVPLGADGSHRDVSFGPAGTVGLNEPVYLTVLNYGDHHVTWQPALFFQGPGNNYIQLSNVTPSVRYLSEPPLPGKAAGAPWGGRIEDAMPGGFHQWSYGVYNASAFAFDPTLLTVDWNSANPPTELSNPALPFFPPQPVAAGLGVLPGLLGSDRPLWKGPSGDDYISVGYIHASYTGSGSVAATPGGAGFRRSTSNSNGGGINVGVTFDLGGGDTGGEIELIDLDGDRRPDLLGMDRFQRNLGLFVDNVVGFGPANAVSISHPFGRFRSIDNSNTRFGFGWGSIASALGDKPSAGGDTDSLSSNLPSFGLGYGTSATRIDLIDINGDGLPDEVRKKVPADGTLEVRINMGMGSRGFLQDNSQSWTMPTMTGAISQVASYLTDPQDVADGLRVQDNASNNTTINIYGVGAGIEYGATRSMVDMIDINGDGLPDRVMKTPSMSDEMLVQINYGAQFGPIEHWNLPSWSPAVSVDTSGLTGVQSAGLGSNDALGYSQTRNAQFTGGGIVPIPIIVVCAVLEFSAFGSLDSRSNTQMAFEDIDGDGRPDQVFKRNDLSLGGPTSPDIWVKLNPTGQANLLKHVDNPLGGSFDVEYARAGNQVDPANHIDDPSNHYVMSAVTVHSQPKDSSGNPVWNADPDERSEFTYAGGFYSRVDREFVGFKTVTTTHVGTSDQPVIVETYDTSDVYHKGLLAKHVVRKRAAGDTSAVTSLPVFDVEEIQYETRVLQGLADAETDPREARFVIDKVHLHRTYEGGGTDPDAATVTRTETRDYDNNFGGITSYEENVGTNLATDDAKFTVTYYQDPTAHIFKPSLLVARDGNGTFMRQRSALYFITGKPSFITDVLQGGRNPDTADLTLVYNGPTDTSDSSYRAANPTTQYLYDQYGNLQVYEDASGYLIVVDSVDPTFHQYPQSLHDNLGYAWQQTFNPRTGALAQTVDINNMTVTYDFDVNDRLSDVKDNSGTQLLIIGYSPAILPSPALATGQPAATVIRYQNPEQSQTVSLADGWGRLIQTKKKAEVDTGTGTATGGLIVSGRVAFDSYGRLVSRGEPHFAAGFVDASTTFDTTAIKNPETFAYDVLSRAIQVTYAPAPPAGCDCSAGLPAASKCPNGSRPPKATHYGVVSVGGVLRAREQTVDSTCEARETYRDAGGRVMSVDEHDKVGTATTLSTLTTTYDYDAMARIRHVIDAKQNSTVAEWDTLGRMITLTSLDAGKTFYDYDLNGNLRRRQNANGKLIQYRYTSNRLDRIDYPDSAAVVLTYGPPLTPGTTDPIRSAGRIVTRTDETGTTNFEYGNFGEITKTTWIAAPPSGQTAQPAYVTSYTYDHVFNSLRTLTVDGETLTYGYDSGGHVKSVSGASNYVTSLLYNEFEQRTSLTLGNSVVTTYGYQAGTRRLNAVNTNSGSLAVQKLQYTYDYEGDVASLDNAVTAPTANPPAGTLIPGKTHQTFTYDDLHQLKNASGTYTGMNSLGNRTYTLGMTYDAIGNIATKNQLDRNRASNGFGATTVTVGATTYNSTYTYGGTRPHALTSIATVGAATQSADYDSDGNQKFLHGAGGVGRDMTWNEEDRIRTLTKSGTTTTYLYRPDGDRAIKRGSSENHYVNPQLVVRVGTQHTRHIMVGDQRVATVVTPTSGSATTFYYHSDHLQSSNYVTNASGTLIQHDEYFPTGESWVEELHSGNTKNPYLFNAKELDSESNLYYYGARYYDPRQSNWVSPDPALFSYMSGKHGGVAHLTRNLALYSYAWNNPVTLLDPDGRMVFLPPLNAPRADVRGTYRREGGGVAGALAVFNLFNPIMGIYDATQRLAGAIINGSKRDVAVAAVETGVAAAGFVGTMHALQPGGRAPQEPARLQRDVDVNPAAPEARPLDRPIGRNTIQNEQLQNDIAMFKADGGRDFRVNQEQVNANGTHVGLNKPDLQYTDKHGVRQYVEYDTPESPRGVGHAVRILANDPNGQVTLVRSPMKKR